MKLPHALPHLEGRRGMFIRAAYVLLAAATLAAAAGSLVFNAVDMFRNVPNSLELGFRTWTENGRAVVRYVDEDGKRAGIRDGDLIVAIAGERLPDPASEFDIGARLARARGDVVTLTVRRSGREVTYRVPRLANVWLRTDSWSRLPVWLYSPIDFLVPQLFALFLVPASLLLFRRRSRDPEAMIFAFAFLLIALSPLGFWIRALFAVPHETFDLMANIGWAAALVAIVSFPDGRFGSWSAQMVALVAPSLILGSSLLSRLWHVPTTVWSATTSLLAFGAGLAVVLRYRRTSAGSERQQIKWAVTGICVALLALLISSAFELLGVWDATRGSAANFLLSSTLTALLVALPLGLLVSLLRYRLYDAESAISRSVAYGVLTLALLAIFAGSEKLIEVLGERYFGESIGALAGALGAAIAAVMIAPLHHRVTHWAEHRFQKDLIRLRHGLPLLVGDLRETAGLGDIAEAVLKRIESGVRAVRGALIVEGAVAATRRVEAGDVEAWARGWLPAEHEGARLRARRPAVPDARAARGRRMGPRRLAAARAAPRRQLLRQGRARGAGRDRRSGGAARSRSSASARRANPRSRRGSARSRRWSRGCSRGAIRRPRVSPGALLHDAGAR
ncbi:MAG: PDZ domain-containing protein [Sphingomonas sp.]